MINWAAIAALCALFAALVSIGMGAFVHGRLTEKVVTNTDALKVHEGRLDEHDEKIGAHDVSIGRLHEWKDGFNAGSRSVGPDKP